MYILEHLYFLSFISLSLATTPPSLGRHATLQARGGLFSKNRGQALIEDAGKGDQPIGTNLPVVKDFSCRGVDKQYCGASCYCNKLGKVICDKRHKKAKLAPEDEWLRKYGTLSLTSVCGPVCSCSVDGVRRSGGLEIPELRRLEMLHQHAREGGRYEGKMSGDLDAMGIGRMSAGSPIAGDPGAGLSNSRARVLGTPRPGSHGNRDYGVGDPGLSGSADPIAGGSSLAGPPGGGVLLNRPSQDNPDAGHFRAGPSNREP